MRRHILCCIAIITLFATVKVKAQDGYNERAKKYIDQYYPLAIAEQKKTGIPASITLGQGILETEAGASELMTEANNHFGIKCNNNWLGLTFTHTDDAPNECFKKYNCAEDSYRDHSLHLKTNRRYSPLFALSTTDYASWAVCLKKCGYATNPQYAQRLIKIIEDFKLQEYTYAALDSTNSGNYPIMPALAKSAPDAALVVKGDKDEIAPVPAKQTEMPAAGKVADNQPDASAADYDNTGKIEMVNGMKAIHVNKGEQLLKYADQYHIRYSRLLEMNDLTDAPVPFDMYVYLEKKLTYGTHEEHKVTYGETVFMIAQAEGMQYKKLLALNLLNPNEEPVTGAILELQQPAAQKPGVRISEIKAHHGNAIVTGTNNDAASGDYIAINRSKPAAAKPPVTAPANGNAYIAANKPKAISPAPAKTVTEETEYEDDSVADVVIATPPPAKRAVAPVRPATTPPAHGDGYVTNWGDDTPTPAKRPIANKPATTTVSQGDGYVTNWGDDAPTPAKRPAATKPATTTNQGDGYVANWGDDAPKPAKQPAIAKTDNAGNTEMKKPNGANPDAAGDDDLASLKADMDKVVYADNGKLPAEKPKAQPDLKKEPVVMEHAKPAAAAKYYTIKKGETAFSIAKRNNISVDELLKMNDIDASGIKAGYKIIVKE